MLASEVDWRPAGQAKQASPPELVPNPSTALFTRVTYEPTGHSSHSVAPSASAKVPLGHGRHSETSTAPGLARVVPLGQGVHWPISHEWQAPTGAQSP